MLATVDAKKPPSSPHLRGDHAASAAAVKFSASITTSDCSKYGIDWETSAAGADFAP